jgi:hypothetical protein
VFDVATSISALHPTAAPQPTEVTHELLEAMNEVIRISDRDHEAWNRAKNAISACRAAMLTGSVVPNEMTGGVAMTQYRIKPSNYNQWVKGWNACRAVIIATRSKATGDKCE